MAYLVPFKLPHFKKEEYEVMKEFLNRRILVGEWKFDVKLFPPERPLRPFETPLDYRIWQHLHAKRIDAVCIDAAFTWILEVKDLLRPSAIGQLYVYKHLYERQYKPVKPIRLGIVVGELDPQVLEVCREHGIKVWCMDIPSRRKRILGLP